MTDTYMVYGNAKLLKSSLDHRMVIGWGIGASDKTCPCKGECAKICYAEQGTYRFKNVREKNAKRLALAESDKFVPTINAEISEVVRKNPDKEIYVRIHDSGDFYSMDYVKKWFDIMRDNPTVKFYAYTKMVRLFQGLIAAGSVPENFKLIMSYGGTQDDLIKPTDCHARVFKDVDELNRAGYTDCSDDDLLVFTTDKVGLVYHGNKNFENTGFITIE